MDLQEVSMLKRLSLSDASSAATLTPHSGTSDGQTCDASTVGTTAFTSLNHSPRGDPSDGCSASSVTSYDRIRRTGGELRQRKYIVPTSRVAAKVSLVPDCGHGQRDRSESVLIQGPLQHQTFLSFWRWRWCVLDHHELRIYKNKENASAGRLPAAELRPVAGQPGARTLTGSTGHRLPEHRCSRDTCGCTPNWTRCAVGGACCRPALVSSLRSVELIGLGDSHSHASPVYFLLLSQVAR
mmetsp:Transcript_113039/g.359145  ORF Transcript_113039/g.359145 Transcript_113039/m.359145 type:complete len:240 (-) Transcript_113039:410-1129(-)